MTDTLEFVLSCYDFDGTGRLTIDEISLAFKSTVTGMCKLEGAGGAGGVGPGLKACPRDVDFEAAAMNAFERRAEESDRFKVKVQRACRVRHFIPVLTLPFGSIVTSMFIFLLVAFISCFRPSQKPTRRFRSPTDEPGSCRCPMWMTTVPVVSLGFMVCR